LTSKLFEFLTTALVQGLFASWKDTLMSK
jgi:hypothetical protein